MQDLAKANMPYVNISLDVGALMNAYKLICNHPKKFENVLVHLRVISKLVTVSGFKDVVYVLLAA